MQEGESLYQHPDQLPPRQRNRNKNENENENENKHSQSRPEPISVPDLREPYPRYSSAEGERRYADNDIYGAYEEGYNGVYDGPPVEESWPYHADGEKLRPHPPQRSQRKLWLWLPVAILLLAMMLFGGIARSWYARVPVHDFPMIRGDYKRGFEQPQRRTSDLIKVGAQPKIVIRVSGSDVHIQSGSAGIVSLDSSGQEDNTDLNEIVNGNEVDINQTAPLFGADSLTISVPADSSLEIHTVTGNANVTGVDGSLSFDSASGNIDLNNVTLRDQSNLHTTSGQVTIHGTLGPGTTRIETTSDDVLVDLVGNSAVNVSTQTVTGNVKNDFVNAHDSTSPNLDIQTVNGNITVTRVQ
jgi:hypothetical protein